MATRQLSQVAGTARHTEGLHHVGNGDATRLLRLQGAQGRDEAAVAVLAVPVPAKTMTTREGRWRCWRATRPDSGGQTRGTEATREC